MRRGYLATVTGATIGGLSGGFGVGALAAYMAVRMRPGDGWAGLFEAVVFGTVGMVLGAGLGAWLALRLRSYEAVGLTAVIAGVAGTAACWASLFGTELLCRDFECLGPIDRQGTFILGSATGFVVAVLAARWVAVWISARLWTDNP